MPDENDSKIVLDTLFSILKIASSAKDLPSLWEPLLEVVLKALKVDAGTLMTLEGDNLVRRVAKGMDPEIMKEPPIPSRRGGVSWSVVNSKKPAVITDLTREKIASKTLAETMHSLVTVPMITRSQVVGVMSVFTRKERNFTDNDINLFATIANQAAVAIVSIRSAELLKENRKRMAELSALNELSRSISTLFDFEETLSSIIGLITKTLGADKGVLVLFDLDEKLLKAVKPAFNLSDSQIRDFRMSSDEGISGQAFCKGIPIMANVLDSKTEVTLRRAKIFDVKSILAAPLKVKSQTLGVIHVFSKLQNNFRPDDLRLLTILSSQAAVVVNSSYIYREIEEERKKDEALLSSIGEGVLAVDKSGKIILLNTAGEQITGFLAEELLDKTFAETLGLWDKGKKTIPEKDSPISRVLEQGKPTALKEIYLKKRDGTLFPCYLSVAATRDADNKVIGAIVVFRDITRELEVELMKQELISIATHELRTPITGIKGYLDMVLAGDTGEINQETKEMLMEITKINQRLGDLVDDLLNVGRIEQGRIEIKPVPMDLGKLISDVVRELQIQAKDKGLELKYQKIEIPQVKADLERTRQVLINLIGNAIKYTQTGSVTIGVSPSLRGASGDAAIRNVARSDSDAAIRNVARSDSDAAIRNVARSDSDAAIRNVARSDSDAAIRNVARSDSDAAISHNGSPRPDGARDDNEGKVVVSVKDTGLGMSQEQQQRLFEKFYRVQNEKTRQITGTGLGLWITKQLVEKMGGKIWVESEEGKGSTFSFALPKI